MSYTTGCSLIVAAALIATVASRSLLSAQYVVMMAASALLYPIFSNVGFRWPEYKYLIIFLILISAPLPGLVSGGRHFLFGNPNNYATCILCIAYFLLLPLKRRALLQLSIIVLTGYFIYTLQSRSALAAHAIFSTFYLFQTYVSRRVLNVICLSTILFFIGSYVTIVTDDRFQLLAAVQDANIGDKGYNGLSFRDVLLYTSLDIVSDNPLGIGMGRSGIAIREAIGVGLSPHNAFLKMAVEGGILMLLGYIIVVVVGLLKTKSPLAASFLVALSVRNLFESATPLTGSIVSAMLILPLFLNESSYDHAERPLGRTRTAFAPAHPLT